MHRLVITCMSMNKKFFIASLVVFAPALITIAFFALVMPILLLLGATSRLSVRGVLEVRYFHILRGRLLYFGGPVQRKVERH